MKRALPIALLLLSGCFSNPLGSSIQDTKYHPGYGQSPEVHSVAPTSGSLQGGTVLTILGSAFQQGAKITLGGNDCASVTFISDTQLTCVTAGHVAGAVALTVTNPDSQSTTLANAFQYFGASKLMAGFGHSNAGGIVTGPGVRMRFTAGAVGNPPQQSGTNVKAATGLQGVWSQP